MTSIFFVEKAECPRVQFGWACEIEQRDEVIKNLQDRVIKQAQEIRLKDNELYRSFIAEMKLYRTICELRNELNDLKECIACGKHPRGKVYCDATGYCGS